MAEVSVAHRTQAIAGGTHCGDACHWQQDGARVSLVLVDGLGHGPDAELAARRVVSFVAQRDSHSLRDLLRDCDTAARDTRGAAMGIARIDLDSGQLRYAGVGNIRAAIVGATSRRLASTPGIIGAGFQRLTIETVDLRPDELVVLYSDGLPDQLDLQELAARFDRQPRELVDHMLGELHSREDDGAALVCRYLAGSAV